MGDQCTYYPEPGPEGETGAGGICPDCMDEGYASYFCSQVCYDANLVSVSSWVAVADREGRGR
jgi:hypothetical protein